MFLVSCTFIKLPQAAISLKSFGKTDGKTGYTGLTQNAPNLFSKVQNKIADPGGGNDYQRGHRYLYEYSGAQAG